MSKKAERQKLILRAAPLVAEVIEFKEQQCPWEILCEPHI